MVQRAPYVLDPDDPRAPTQADWERMSPEQRAEVVAMLPNEVPLEMMAPEGDPHREAKQSTLDALGRFFRRVGRRVYLSSELAVFYPGERRFAPDVLAVVDVDPHLRNKWVVSQEGKGLDFVLEVHVEGDKAKDHERNVAIYARLGIPEYFIFDRGRLRLSAFALPEGERTYRPILPQQGRYASRVLGLDLALEGTRLRYFQGTAPLEEADELIGRMGTMVDALLQKREDAERSIAEERQRADEERQRADEERQRADEAERALAEAKQEIERLRRGR